MNHLVKTLFSILIVCCVLSFFDISLVTANDSEIYIKDLLYPKATKVRTHEHEKDDVFVKIYEVRSPYPSKKVIEFYDNELKKIGWIPFIEPYYKDSDRVWNCYVDLTINGAPLKHELVAKWVNKQKDRMVMVILTYYSYPPERKENYCNTGPDNNIQAVTVQIMPFVTLPPP